MQAIGRTRTHGKNDNPGECRAGWGGTGWEIFSSLHTGHQIDRTLENDPSLVTWLTHSMAGRSPGFHEGKW